MAKELKPEPRSCENLLAYNIEQAQYTSDGEKIKGTEREMVMLVNTADYSPRQAVEVLM